MLVVLLALGAGLASVALIAAPVRDDFTWIAAVAIFIFVYAALAVGRIPGLALDCAGIALVGPALMVACGALPLAAAYKAVDLDRRISRYSCQTSHITIRSSTVSAIRPNECE